MAISSSSISHLRALACGDVMLRNSAKSETAAILATMAAARSSMVKETQDLVGARVGVGSSVGRGSIVGNLVDTGLAVVGSFVVGATGLRVGGIATVGIRVGGTVSVGLRVGGIVTVGLRVGGTVTVGLRVGGTVTVGLRVGGTVTVGLRVGGTVTVGLRVGGTVAVGLRVGGTVTVGLRVGGTVTIGLWDGMALGFSEIATDGAVVGMPAGPRDAGGIVVGALDWIDGEDDGMLEGMRVLTGVADGVWLGKSMLMPWSASTSSTSLSSSSSS